MPKISLACLDADQNRFIFGATGGQFVLVAATSAIGAIGGGRIGSDKGIGALIEKSA